MTETKQKQDIPICPQTISGKELAANFSYYTGQAIKTLWDNNNTSLGRGKIQAARWYLTQELERILAIESWFTELQPQRFGQTRSFRFKPTKVLSQEQLISVLSCIIAPLDNYNDSMLIAPRQHYFNGALLECYPLDMKGTIYAILDGSEFIICITNPEVSHNFIEGVKLVIQSTLVAGIDVVNE